MNALNEDDELIAVVKRDCPTCRLVAPVLAAMGDLTVVSQDDPSFPEGCEGVIDDQELSNSFKLDIEIVPTLLRREGGQEVDRAIGWCRTDWERVSGQRNLGPGLPDQRPGCGSKSVGPGVSEHLRARFGRLSFASRRIEVELYEDPHEKAFEMGWSDGLPVVPPTAERILRMLGGTRRDPAAIVGSIPPSLAPCSVEKVAVNAVLAGCKPEYMPLLLGIVEGALDPLFTLHGLLCTTCFSAPIIVVNGPVTRRIGMNWGLNALGQGNRANASIGRALNLIVRNVGGGRPGEIDRSTMGFPGKFTFCFAEDETDPTWEPLAQSRGVPPGRNAVTLFQGNGIQSIIDQRSRTAAELVRSLAMSLLSVGHLKMCEGVNALLIISPEHWSAFAAEGWTRRDLEDALREAMMRPGRDLIRGAQGVGEGIEPSRAEEAAVPKFHEGGLLIARAGGEAGRYSAICAGWTMGRKKEYSRPVTREISDEA